VTRQGLTGDLWGALSATLVALPSAIAFGVTIYSPLGGNLAAQGAVAGILGAIVLGLVAPSLGCAKLLITAPSAPVAAVLSALAIELTMKGVPASTAVSMMMLVALACGALQLLFAALGLGSLIKYMPYSVTSGYLTGVGLLIVAGQLPRWLGAPKSMGFWQTLGSPGTWRWQSIAVGVVTMAVMWLAPRVTRLVPAPVLGLVAGGLTFFGLGLLDHSMLSSNSPLVIGSIGASVAELLPTVVSRWQAIGGVPLSYFPMLASAAISLSVLLSIDTLKTCVMLDTATRERNDSNRELVGQGAGNLASALVGGMPGSGASGATMVNMWSGGNTRRSGIFTGLMALAVFLLFGRLIAWLPIAALAGIMIVVGMRMCDFESLVRLYRARDTFLDFLVIAMVVLVSLGINLIWASTVGIALATLLFIRQQIGASVVHSKSYGNLTFSKQVRLPSEMAILEKRGDCMVLFELQDSLFFGTADQLYSALEPELKTRQYIILDMRRVRVVDLTAAHLLVTIEDILKERDAELILSHFPAQAPSRRDMERYLKRTGAVAPGRHVHVFAHLDEALVYVENRILEPEQMVHDEEPPLELRDVALFEGRKQETLEALEQCMEKRTVAAGQQIFKAGDPGHELFLIRRGSVRIVQVLSGGQGHYLASFGRGDFFGEMGFLDEGTRSSDAIAVRETELYVLARSHFEKLVEQHRVLGLNLVEGLARTLSLRLRHANKELRSFHES